MGGDVMSLAAEMTPYISAAVAYGGVLPGSPSGYVPTGTLTLPGRDQTIVTYRHQGK